MPKNNFDDDDDDLLMALQSMEPCGNCGAEGAKIPCMSGCGEVFYCSRECNMHHASAHRLRCRNLRCSKFNDSESDSDSDDYEEFTDDSDAEYETDDGEDDDEEDEEEEVKAKKGSKKKGKKRTKSKRTNSSRSVESGASTLSRKVSIDADIEKRIEEKILKRLKKQEEQRIAMAIEQRMREAKAGWRDDEMNRIIMEMRERFQSEMSNSAFFSTLAKKNGLAVDSQEMQALQQSMESSFINANPQAEDKSMAVAGASGLDGEAGDGSRARAVSKESSWNNACRGFEALRVVVWKHSFLPKMKFERDDASGIWNCVTEVDADESFAHILAGDKLLSVNGRAIDDTCQTEEDIDDVFAAYASPLIMKFEAADPANNKVHDYTVTWSNGPLGVTLKDDCTTQKIPIVNRLTKKAGSVAVKQNIAIGDVLVAINNIDTIQLGCSLSMSILKKVQLPAKLRFRGVGGPAPGSDAALEAQAALGLDVDRMKPSDGLGGMGPRTPSMNNFGSSMSRPSTYNINWAEGPLGLTIIPGISDGDMPVIKKVTGTGSSFGIEKAQVGDYLESMNDQQASRMHFEDVVAYLKTTPKPVMLRFRTATGDDQPAPAPVPAPPAASPSYKSVSVKTVSAVASSSTVVDNRASYESNTYRTSSTRSGSAVQISREERQEIYRVVWGDGPLGLTIDANTTGPGAFIKRISSQGAAAHLSQDCIHDDLTHINDMDVTRVMFQDIVAHLRNVPRPVTLMFKRRDLSARHGSFSSTSSRTSDVPVAAPPAPPSSGSSRGVRYYNIVWQDGIGLGLSLRGADATSEYPYITRVTGTGSAAHLPQSVTNDCLISVDGRSVHVRDKSFDEVMTMLKVMQKPLTLKFQSRSDAGPPPPAPNVYQPPPPPPNVYQPQQQQIQQYSRPGSASNMYAPPPAPYAAPPPAPYAAPPPAYAAASPAPLPAPRSPAHPGPRTPALPGVRSAVMPGRAPPAKQESYTWRQNRAAAPAGPVASQQQLSQSYSNVSSSSAPMQSNMAASQGPTAMSRSYAAGSSDRGLAAGAAGGDDKFNSIQAPFLAQNKLSTGRRQKMLKGLKK